MSWERLHISLLGGLRFATVQIKWHPLNTPKEEKKRWNPNQNNILLKSAFYLVGSYEEKKKKHNYISKNSSSTEDLNWKQHWEDAEVPEQYITEPWKKKIQRKILVLDKIIRTPFPTSGICNHHLLNESCCCWSSEWSIRWGCTEVLQGEYQPPRDTDSACLGSDIWKETRKLWLCIDLTVLHWNNQNPGLHRL